MANVESTGWVGDPVWLEDVLRDALGDRLVVHEDWQDRGTGDGENGTRQMGPIWGVMIHHTGNKCEQPETIRDGCFQPITGWLQGPLSQGLITPDGKFHLVAIGPCNHAGPGTYAGIDDNTANTRLISFECAWPTIAPDGSYDDSEPWPEAQMNTMRDATAAVLAELGYDSSHVIGHKDWAGGRKWDPGNLDMKGFRGEVAKAMRGEFKQFDKMNVPVANEVDKINVPALNERTDRQLLEDIWEQLRGPGGNGWPQLGGRNLVDAVAELLRAVTQPAQPGPSSVASNGTTADVASTVIVTPSG